MNRLTKDLKTPHNDTTYSDIVKNSVDREQIALTKLKIYEDLEEQLGCPLDVVFRILKGEKIIFEDREYFGSLRWNIYTEEFVFDLSSEGYEIGEYLTTKGYSKNWRLKGDKDE